MFVPVELGDIFQFAWFFMFFELCLYLYATLVAFRTATASGGLEEEEDVEEASITHHHLSSGFQIITAIY